jgi:hypothetical protein
VQIVDLYTPVAGNSNIFLSAGGTSWGVNMSPRSEHEARDVAKGGLLFGGEITERLQRFRRLLGFFSGRAGRVGLGRQMLVRSCSLVAPLREKAAARRFPFFEFSFHI